MTARYVPVSMEDGREGIEFTGIVSVPAGTDPSTALAVLRDIVTTALRPVIQGDGNWRLEDLGLWPESAGQRATREGERS